MVAHGLPHDGSMDDGRWAKGDQSLAFTLSLEGKPGGKRERLHTWTCPSGLHIGSLHQKIMQVFGVRSPLKSLTRGGATHVWGLTGDRRRRDKDSRKLWTGSRTGHHPRKYQFIHAPPMNPHKDGQKALQPRHLRNDS